MASRTALAKKGTKALARTIAPAKVDAIQKKFITMQRIEGIISAVATEIEPFAKKQDDLAKKIKRIDITDQKSFDSANDLYREINEYADDATEVVETIIEVANKFHKGLTALRKPILDKQEENADALGSKIQEYDERLQREQEERDRQAQLKAQEEADRLRRQREKEEREAKEKADKAAAELAEAQRIEREAKQKAEAAAEEKRKAEQAVIDAANEEERKKAEEKQAEADRIAKEAAKEASKAESKVERAEEKADSKQAELQMASAVKEEPIEVEERFAAPIHSRSSAAFSMVDNWVGKCDELWLGIRFILGVPEGQPTAHPELMKLISHDQKQLNLMAAAQKEVFRVPGFRAVNEQFRRGSR